MNRKLLMVVAVQSLPKGLPDEVADPLLSEFDALLATCGQPGYEERTQEWFSRWGHVFKPVVGDPIECRRCDGYGYLITNGQVERCDCQTNSATQSRDRNYRAQLTPETVIIVQSAHRSRGAIAKANLIWNYKTPAVFLHGAVGTGKTIAGHVIVREWISRLNLSAHCLPAERTANAMKARAYGDADQQASAGQWILNAQKVCRESGIVFIDDLCAERMTDASSQEVAEQIRLLYERRARCVLTTNSNLSGIGERYGSDVLDRLKDSAWCTSVDCGTESLRR